MVAALFALHPLHVESVAWVAERKDVLSTFFWLGTMLAYAGTPWRHLAALSVGPAVPHPGAVGQTHAGHPALGAAAPGLLASGTVPGGPPPRRAWPESGEPQPAPATPVYWRLLQEKIPLFALVGLSCLITMMAQKGSGAVMPLAIRPLGPRIANALVSYGDYVVKLFWPFPMVFFYQLAPGVLVAGGGSRPGLAGGDGFPGLRGQTPAVSDRGLALVPGHHGAGDRADPGGRPGQGGSLYLYPAHRPVRHDRLGCIRGHCRLAAPPGPALQRGAAALLACLLATWVQVGYWRNSETLFTHALQVDPTNYMAYHHLGMALANEGKINQAIDMYRKTLAVAPEYPSAYNNLAIVYAEQGRYDEAVSLFKAAIRLTPNNISFYRNLALAYQKQEKSQKPGGMGPGPLALRGAGPRRQTD